MIEELAGIDLFTNTYWVPDFFVGNAESENIGKFITSLGLNFRSFETQQNPRYEYFYSNVSMHDNITLSFRDDTDIKCFQHIRDWWEAFYDTTSGAFRTFNNRDAVPTKDISIYIFKADNQQIRKQKRQPYIKSTKIAENLLARRLQHLALSAPIRFRSFINDGIPDYKLSIETPAVPQIPSTLELRPRDAIARASTVTNLIPGAPNINDAGTLAGGITNVISGGTTDYIRVPEPIVNNRMNLRQLDEQEATDLESGGALSVIGNFEIKGCRPVSYTFSEFDYSNGDAKLFDIEIAPNEIVFKKTEAIEKKVEVEAL